MILGMSVYEQIASKTRNRRLKPAHNDNKLDEQTEEEDEDEDDRIPINDQVKFLIKNNRIYSYLLASECKFHSSSESLSIFDNDPRFIDFIPRCTSTTFTSFTSTS